MYGHAGEGQTGDVVGDIRAVQQHQVFRHSQPAQSARQDQVVIHVQTPHRPAAWPEHESQRQQEVMAELILVRRYEQKTDIDTLNYIDYIDIDD